MRHLFFFLLFLCSPSLAVVAAPSAEEAEASGQARRLSPVEMAVQQRLDQEKAELARLYERLAVAADPEVAMGLQKQVQQVKLQTEIDLLGIQLEHAEAAGQAEQAAEIRAAIEGLQNPPRPQPATTPIPRTPPTSRSEEGR